VNFWSDHRPSSSTTKAGGKLGTLPGRPRWRVAAGTIRLAVSLTPGPVTALMGRLPDIR
jgi:hypothetical protein